MIICIVFDKKSAVWNIKRRIFEYTGYKKYSKEMFGDLKITGDKDET